MNMDSLLSLQDLSSHELKQILDYSFRFKRSRRSLWPTKTLKHKSIGLLFTKPSTRTLVSFQVSINQLGGYPCVLDPNHLQLARNEDLQLTVDILSGYLDGLIIRNHDHALLERIRETSSIPLVNALSAQSHPCQFIADIMTIFEAGYSSDQAKVCFMGDGASNIAHSLMSGTVLLPFDLYIVCPKAYQPAPELLHSIQNQGGKITVTQSVDSIIKDINVFYTDTWVSMGQEQYANEKKRTLQPYQINSNLVERADKDAIIMHCLPAKIGDEITSDVFYSKQSWIMQQAENKLYTAKGLLHYLYSS